mmetsp:Transcript_19489/g.24539  ORF Transcript_19489/g.24539 Transcript_19489/m.24539 type:complete len:134 (+) Transcript_19489:120-521(+)
MSSYDDDMQHEEIPAKILDLAQGSAPTSLKTMRACKRCGILKTLHQFLNEGCDNCPYLEMADDRERCNMLTSAFFEGVVAVMDPSDSWAAKWLRVDNCVPGVYAITVTGQLDPNTIEDLENKGIKYRCRPAGS